MRNDQWRQFFTLLAIMGMIAMTIIAQVSDLGGKPIDEVSDGSFTLITPVDWAFSIWGLIYAGLFAFAIYQVLPSQRDNPRFRRASGWIIINALANILWYPAAYWQTWNSGLSVLLIVLMLYTLLEINRAFEIRYTSVSTAEVLLARAPFAIYFGWITVATAVSVASYLTYNGWDGAGITVDMWAVIILAVSLLIAIFTYFRVTNFFYLLTIAWGFAGIAVAQQSTSKVVYLTSLIGAAVMLVIGIVSMLNHRRVEVESVMVEN